MEIYVSKDGAQTGPFPMEEIQKMVAAGQYSSTDHGWHDGLPDWVPLLSILPTKTTSGPPPPPPPPVKKEDSTGDFKKKAGAVLNSVAEKISSAAGIEKVESIHPKGMFSDVFKKRTEEEIADYFNVGTTTTTPSLEQINTNWPKPWAFSIIFAISLIAFAGLHIINSDFNNELAIPSILIVGAFAVPLSVLVLFFELNTPRNIPIYQIFKLVVIGGVFSLVLTHFLGMAQNHGLDWMGDSAAGLVEEPAKLLAMLIVVNIMRYRWILNGLLIGACVGTGFAVVETAGYAFRGDLEYGVPFESILWSRAILYPLGGHAIMSAIVGGALWKVKGNNKFKLAMLTDRRFLRLLAVAAIAHMIWNLPIELPFDIKNLAVGFALWVVVFGLVQEGLKQVREAQKAEAKSGTQVPTEGLIVVAE